MKQAVSERLNKLFRLQDHEGKGIVDQGEVSVCYSLAADEVADRFKGNPSSARFVCRTPAFAAKIIKGAEEPDSLYRRDKDLPVIYIDPVNPAHDGGFNHFPQGKLKMIFKDRSSPSRLYVAPTWKDGLDASLPLIFSLFDEDEEAPDEYSDLPEEGPSFDALVAEMEKRERWSDLDWTVFVPSQ